MPQSKSQRSKGGDEGRGGFLNPFKDMESFFSDPFNMMKRSNDIFAQHFSQMEDMMSNGFGSIPEGAQCYVSSTVTTTLPNGVTESKRVIRTNDMEQKEHFQQIGDRSRVAKYTKNLNSGEEVLRKDAKNIRDDEMDQFKNEFMQYQQNFRSTFGGALTGFGAEDSGRDDRLGRYLK